MRIVRDVEVGGHRVTVRELTVGEVRAWLRALDREGDAVDWSLFEELSLTDLYHLTSLTPDIADSLTPREVREVIGLARELNADFFGMRARLAQAGARIMERSSASSAG